MKRKLHIMFLSVVLSCTALFGVNLNNINAYEDERASVTHVYDGFEEVSVVNSIVLKTAETKPESVVGIDVEIGIENNTPVRELTIEEKIKESCDEYGIPFDIVLAIARLETGWFKSSAYVYGNNPGGLLHKVNGVYVPMSFDTIEDGVEWFVSNLANNYFAIGLDTPAEIGAKYCPGSSSWVKLVEEMRWYDTGL